MPTLVDSDTFAFSDGNSGHVCDLGAAPEAGQWDVLCVNSDTVVSTPAGFTLAESSVGSQGAYVFTRQAIGTEGSTVTVTTSGNFNCQVSWSRWGDTDALDTSTNTAVNGTGATSTPAHSTGLLAEPDELVIAFGALHSLGGALPNTPVWSAGFTPLTLVTQGTSSSGVAGLVGYKTGAGTAAETPQVSWSGDATSDRYMLAVSFTAGEGDTSVGAQPRVVAQAEPSRITATTRSYRVRQQTGGRR